MLKRLVMALLLWTTFAFLTVGASAQAQVLDGTYDATGTNPNGTTYSGEVTIQQNGSVYYFKWRIGRQVFEGRGTLRGDVLTVDWGQRYPVIYRISSDGVLRGTWNNGEATEDLSPRSRNSREEASQLNGVYNVKGKNPNGTTYRGEVTIQLRGSVYYFTWRIGGGQTFTGRGTLRDDVLTVDWGQQYPVIYRVSSDGILRGTWNNGEATEDLYPR